MKVPAKFRAEVVRRAKGRCEYCRLSQEGQEAAFHVDHVQPLAEQGPTDLSNLALACVSCSLRKGARRTPTDPVSGTRVPIFHPRDMKWSDHFRWSQTRIAGLTAIGRATVETLRMNREIAVAIRVEEIRLGRHPVD